MNKQTELQWAGIQTNFAGILVDKAGWQRMCTVGVRALSACVHWSQLWRALSAAHTGIFSDTNALRALPLSGRHVGTDAVVL